MCKRGKSTVSLIEALGPEGNKKKKAREIMGKLWLRNIANKKYHFADLLTGLAGYK